MTRMELRMALRDIFFWSVARCPPMLIPMLLRACRFEFQFPRSPLVVGILNVTPDSFSDGGQFQDVGAAVARGLRMVEEGADMIDIGGESTRPGAAPVSEAEERSRVLPVIKRLSEVVKLPISIDTVKIEVAEAALDAGGRTGCRRSSPDAKCMKTAWCCTTCRRATLRA